MARTSVFSTDNQSLELLSSGNYRRRKVRAQSLIAEWEVQKFRPLQTLVPQPILVDTGRLPDSSLAVEIELMNLNAAQSIVRTSYDDASSSSKNHLRLR